MWAIVTRHPSHPDGQWTHMVTMFETLEQASAAARELCEGTPMEWRLLDLLTWTPNLDRA
jgi:hypothetical protein